MNVDRSDEADVRRMRWLLAGNGYFMEEEGLCGHPPTSEKERDDARKEIDEAMAEDARWKGEQVILPAVYVASRASLPARPEMWRKRRSLGWRITSTWIDEAGPGETNDFTDLWIRINHEVRQSCGVILYAEFEDFPLKGAFVEVGLALGMNKPIAVVLPNVDIEPINRRPIGSWIMHPLVIMCPNIDEAYRRLTNI